MSYKQNNVNFSVNRTVVPIYIKFRTSFLLGASMSIHIPITFSCHGIRSRRLREYSFVTKYALASSHKQCMRLLTGLFVAFCVLAAQSAFSLSFESKGFDDLVAEAEQVFIGTIADSSSRYTGRGIIVTDYRFDVVETIKGSVPAGLITITMLGGKVGQVELTIPGAPTFRAGIRYLLFVAGNGTVIFPTVGGTQGIFQIRVDPSSGIARVHDFSGNPLTELPQRSTAIKQQSVAPGSPAAPAASAEMTAPTALSLDSFNAAIRSRLKP